MKVNCAWEHNGDDTLLYAVNCVGESPKKIV